MDNIIYLVEIFILPERFQSSRWIGFVKIVLISFDISLAFLIFWPVADYHIQGHWWFDLNWLFYDYSHYHSSSGPYRQVNFFTEAKLEISLSVYGLQPPPWVGLGRSSIYRQKFWWIFDKKEAFNLVKYKIEICHECHIFQIFSGKFSFKFHANSFLLPLSPILMPRYS